LSLLEELTKPLAKSPCLNSSSKKSQTLKLHKQVGDAQKSVINTGEDKSSSKSGAEEWGGQKV
jgi:hypothetical protein